MRRSTAPSKLNKRFNLFSPPFKDSINNKDITKQHMSTPNLNKTANKNIDSFRKEEQINPAAKRSKSDLLNLIKDSPSTSAHNDNLEVSIQEDSQICDNSNINQVEKCTPFHNVDQISNEYSDDSLNNSSNETRYFSVVWCKLSRKKHKNWEGDAVLIVKGRSVNVKDMEGKEIARSSGYKLKDLESLQEGNTLSVGAKEVEIQGIILEENYRNGSCFQDNFSTSDKCPSPNVTKPKFKPFCLPTKKKSNVTTESKSLFDSSHPDAIVMPRPPSNHQWSYNNQSLAVTDVVIDPYLGSKLRPHQQTGINFLYECILGFRQKQYHGAILADEMGLGKTLQCITLIWILLKQGPYGCVPILKCVLIVTPSSIVANWGREFDIWLGKERIKPFIVDQYNKVEEFVKNRSSKILIISYEMLIRQMDKIEKYPFDLLLCDEGHRLKNGAIKTTSLLAQLNIKRRIIVTGTPIQNDMQELFALVDFVNPGILGTSAMFKRIYEEPIMKAQMPSADIEEKQLGDSRASELNRITSQFILRRTQEIINRYLPPKNEFVVFCQPSPAQCDIYKALSTCRGLQECLLSVELGDTLSAICILRKLCNHPALLCAYEDKENLSNIQNEVIKILPDEFQKEIYMEQESGKLAVVSCLLCSIYEAKRERVVIVSNFTTTLNMLQKLCERYNYSFLRLDGSTPTCKRQTLVERFNRKDCPEFVFLLSAKAGGVGLNLIGASRIILFDIDWNPATDLQAMARVWRDGQKKTVYIYRLLLAGSIEEKIYQRQVFKQRISGSIVDARKDSKVKFSAEELKDLFTFHPDVLCLTHDSINCPCDQTGGFSEEMSPTSSQTEYRECQLLEETSKLVAKTNTMDQLHRWQHFAIEKGAHMIGDTHLEDALDFVNFVFKCKVGQ